ncbi:MAG: Glu-tRNA(Gln) amidotransferase subunit GatD [Thermoplasmata archaeon]
MSDRKGLHEMLEASGIAPGDVIEVTTEGGKIVRGVLMPHHEFSSEDVIVIKLPSGYNIGIVPKNGDSVRLVSKSDKKGESEKTRVVEESGKKRSGKSIKTRLPEISIVSTGGTIASYVDYRTGAVKPAISPDELARSVPELLEMARPKTEVLYSILSENMRPEIWTHLAEKVADHLNEGSVGCIVPHGTDTMGFSAAALSFSLDNLTGPVVLVGSQRSSDRPSSDSTMNLLAATKVCLESDLGEVVVLMHASTDDSECAIHRGTRVRKCHSSRRDAFKSINEPPLGTVSEGKVTLREGYEKRKQGKVTARAEFDEDVAMIQFYPGMSTSRFEKALEGASGVVIGGTGLGHVHQEAIPIIRRLTGQGIPVCITTQCIWGATDLKVYSTGRDMLLAGAIPLGDMLTETAYVKLSWALGQESEYEKIKEIMVSNLRHELSDRRAL